MGPWVSQRSELHRSPEAQSPLRPQGRERALRDTRRAEDRARPAPEQGHQPTRREGPGQAPLTQLFPRKKLAAKQPLTRRSPGWGRNPEQGAQPPAPSPPPQALGFWFVFLRAAVQGTAGGAREVSGELGELQGWAPPALPLPVLQRRLQGQRGSIQSCPVRSPEPGCRPTGACPSPTCTAQPLLLTPANPHWLESPAQVTAGSWGAWRQGLAGWDAAGHPGAGARLRQRNPCGF